MISLNVCLPRRISVLMAAYTLCGLVLATPFINQPQAQTVRKVDKPDLRVGDTWLYRRPYSGENETWVIKEIKDGKVYVQQKNDCGRDTLVYTTEWGIVGFCGKSGPRSISAPQTYGEPSKLMPFPVSEGQSWSLNYRALGGSIRYNEGKALGWENITVPAGTFEALKMEIVTQGFGGTPLKNTRWYSPEISNFVKSVNSSEGHQDYELVSYKRGEGK